MTLEDFRLPYIIIHVCNDDDDIIVVLPELILDGIKTYFVPAITINKCVLCDNYIELSALCACMTVTCLAL